jgi:hypothetical protein
MTKSKEGVAHTVVNLIGKLSQIESEIKEITPADKFNIRIEKAKPILNELHDCLTTMHPRTFPKSL